MSIEIISGFESTYIPGFDRDVAETTGHVQRRRADLELLASCGVRTLRYPIRWHRVEQRAGQFDWGETDSVMAMLDELHLHPIVDLVHHTSYPKWLELGFADARFGPSYLRYVEAFARRYPHVRDYTLFNEPFSTLLLCGHEGAWPPYRSGMRAFVGILQNVLPAVGEAARRYRELLPRARHVWVDSCERHTGSGRSGRRFARYANDRRFFVLDAVLGTIDSSSGRPFVADVVDHRGADLLELDPCPVDVVGLDYYAHCQWHFGPVRGTAPSPHLAPLADVIVEYSMRYGRPCMISETNIRGTASDRATWLKYVLEQSESAIIRGVDLQGVCWFPFVDSCDWDTLLRDCRGNLDPVGVVTLEPDRSRHTTSMTQSFAQAAKGASASSLPAYALQEPPASWLRGHLRHTAHWSWDEPSPVDRVEESLPADRDFRPLGACAVAAATS
jgi:beta-glucosidase/6-phospho-beta-glucosidase/beta-galactosidase